MEFVIYIVIYIVIFVLKVMFVNIDNIFIIYVLWIWIWFLIIYFYWYEKVDDVDFLENKMISYKLF